MVFFRAFFSASYDVYVWGCIVLIDVFISSTLVVKMDVSTHRASQSLVIEEVEFDVSTL